MKVERLKEIIKEATREVIQEELKEILLEAVKSKSSPTLNENRTFTPQQKEVKANLRSSYKDILGETAQTMTTNNLQGTFTPNPGVDSANGALPSGQVSMDQIGALLQGK
jgi:F420-0:gamma-glutamyl ligase